MIASETVAEHLNLDIDTDMTHQTPNVYYLGFPENVGWSYFLTCRCFLYHILTVRNTQGSPASYPRACYKDPLRNPGLLYLCVGPMIVTHAATVV